MALDNSNNELGNASYSFQLFVGDAAPTTLTCSNCSGVAPNHEATLGSYLNLTMSPYRPYDIQYYDASQENWVSLGSVPCEWWWGWCGFGFQLSNPSWVGQTVMIRAVPPSSPCDPPADTIYLQVRRPQGDVMSDSIPIVLQPAWGGSVYRPSSSSITSVSTVGYSDDYFSSYPDIVWSITLPACLDSMRVEACGATALYILQGNDTITGVWQGGCYTVTIYRGQGSGSMTTGTGFLNLSTGQRLFIIAEGQPNSWIGIDIDGFKGVQPRMDELIGGTPVCAGRSISISVSNHSDMPTGVRYTFYKDGSPVPNCQNITSPSCDVSVSSTVGTIHSVYVEAQVDTGVCTAGITSAYYYLESVSTPAQPQAGTVSLVSNRCNPPFCSVSGDTATLYLNGYLELQVSGATTSFPYTYYWERSGDGGQTWEPLQSFSPLTVSPASAQEMGTYLYRYKVLPPRSCGLTDTVSNAFVVRIIDRPGNRRENALPLTLTQSGGIWTATVTDSLYQAVGLTDEFSPLNGDRLGLSGSIDLFFLLPLPQNICFDSLVVRTCGTNTNLPSGNALHLIHSTARDTISNYRCIPQSLYSTIKAIGGESSVQIGPFENFEFVLNRTRPDTMPLRGGDTLYIVVEGYAWNSFSNRLELQIAAYPSPAVSLGQPNLGPDTSICLTSLPYSLRGTTSGATHYQWTVNGAPVSGTDSILAFTASVPGTYIVEVTALAFSPNGGICTRLASDAVQITVSPLPSTRIRVRGVTVENGDTLYLLVPDTLRATAVGIAGNTYTWTLYRQGSSGFSPIGSPVSGLSVSFSITDSDIYLLILRSQNGACEEADTLFILGSRSTALAGGSTGRFTAYPNPSNGSLIITTPGHDRYEWEVQDMSGKVVAAGRFEGLSERLSLALPAGLYQMRLRSSRHMGTLRLLLTE